MGTKTDKTSKKAFKITKNVKRSTVEMLAEVRAGINFYDIIDEKDAEIERLKEQLWIGYRAAKCIKKEMVILERALKKRKTKSNGR
jgi:hypothetical protein